MADGRWPYMEDITSNFIYLRLHGNKKIYSSNYGTEDLLFWKKRILNWSSGQLTASKYSLTKNKKKAPKDIFVYFNNDEKIHAPSNALSLIKLLKGKEI